MSKASFEVAGIKFTDVDVGNNGMLSVKLPTCGEVMAYERGRAAGRAEERADIVAHVRKKADATQALEDEFFGLHGSSSSWGELAEDLRLLAAEIEERAKAPAERQDARDGQEGIRAGSEQESRVGRAFP